MGGGSKQPSCVSRQRQRGRRHEAAAKRRPWKKQMRAVREGGVAKRGKERGKGRGNRRTMKGTWEAGTGLWWSRGSTLVALGGSRAWTAGSVTPPHVRHRRRGLSGPATVARQRTGPARAHGRRSERLWRGGWHTACGQTDFLSPSRPSSTELQLADTITISHRMRDTESEVHRQFVSWFQLVAIDLRRRAADPNTRRRRHLEAPSSFEVVSSAPANKRVARSRVAGFIPHLVRSPCWLSCAKMTGL